MGKTPNQPLEAVDTTLWPRFKDQHNSRPLKQVDSLCMSELAGKEDDMLRKGRAHCCLSRDNMSVGLVSA